MRCVWTLVQLVNRAMAKKSPAQRFQDEMKKLGMGVSIQFGDREPVVVTEWRCPECAARREVSTENKTGVPCPRCDSKMPAVLE